MSTFYGGPQLSSVQSLNTTGLTPVSYTVPSGFFAEVSIWGTDDTFADVGGVAFVSTQFPLNITVTQGVAISVNCGFSGGDRVRASILVYKNP